EVDAVEVGDQRAAPAAGAFELRGHVLAAGPQAQGAELAAGGVAVRGEAPPEHRQRPHHATRFHAARKRTSDAECPAARNRAAISRYDRAGVSLVRISSTMTSSASSVIAGALSSDRVAIGSDGPNTVRTQQCLTQVGTRDGTLVSA